MPMWSFADRVRLAGQINRAAWPLAARVGAAYRAITRGRQRLLVVVGSLGKTTTTRAAMAALTGDAPDWLAESDNCFSSIVSNLVRQGPQAPVAVVEVGIALRGQMERYASLLRPDAVVVTAIATDHLANFGGPERLWKEKSMMLRGLAPGGIALLNGDDEAVMRMAPLTRARVVTFGLSPSCDVFADQIAVDARAGSRFTLHVAGASLPVESRLVGHAGVRALAAAAAAGWAFGVPLATIATRLARLSPTPGRMQPVPLASGAVALCDDFKAGVETVHAALDAFGDIRARKRIVVLGNLFRPPAPAQAHYDAVGAQAARVADRVVLIGAETHRYAGGLRGRLPDDAVTSVASVAEAAAQLRAELGPDDVVLIKGQGEQKLARVALALAGRQVDCERAMCSFELVYCQTCPMLRAPSTYA